MPRSDTNRQFADQLAVVEAMLRVIKPDQPFQPVLAASIDRAAWEALFVKACEDLATASHELPPADPRRQASCDLHDFAATIFAPAYFHRFQRPHSPDHDPQDFAPDPEFFDNDARWLRATSQAETARDLIAHKLSAVDERWKNTCHEFVDDVQTSHVGRDADLLGALIDSSGTSHARDTVLDWLTSVHEGAGSESQRRGIRLQLGAFIAGLRQRQLSVAVQRVLPSVAAAARMSAAIRSARQTLHKKLEKVLADMRACCHLREGWETLADYLITAHALSELVEPIRRLSAPDTPRQSDAPRSASAILASFSRLSEEILNRHLQNSWWEHLEQQSDQRETAVVSLKLMSEGIPAIGKNTLGRKLQDSTGSPSATGWTDKAEERLRALGEPLIAIHGSENWIPPPAPAAGRYRRPRAGQGWLINPLIVIHPLIHRAM
jgi:hypothetical protein